MFTVIFVQRVVRNINNINNNNIDDVVIIYSYI